MAEALWRDAISLREPLLVGSFVDFADLKQLRSWDNAYLKAAAGDRAVQIEYRAGSKDGYGKGQRKPMRFGDFVDLLDAGDDKLYLTTQEVKTASDGHPELCAAPVSCLLDSLPLQPSITGHLVPQSINMWMGAAQEGTSSGLHHDFHDNLYVLLRGRKRFRLWPPQAAPRMYTQGKLQRVHDNGRIVYAGQGDVLPDGSAAADVSAWRKRSTAEAAVKQAGQQLEAVARGEQVLVAGKRLTQQEAQQQLDAAEARLLAVIDDIIEEGDFDSLVDDFDLGEQQEREAAAARSAACAGAGTEPPSFSKVELALPAAQLKQRFPRFPGLGAAKEVVVEAGQMLYLPAGWFHEVISFGSPAAGGHMALNYWFHPPDNLQRGHAGFKQPYTSGYWPALWAERLQRLRPALAAPSSSAGGAAQQGAANGTTSSSRKQKKAKKAKGKEAGAAPADAEELLHEALAQAEAEAEDGAVGGSGAQRGGRRGQIQLDPELMKQLLQAYFMQGGQQPQQQRRPYRKPKGRRHHVAVAIKDLSTAMKRKPRPLPRR